MNLLRPSLTQLRQLSSGRVVNNTSWPKPDYGPMDVQRSVLMNGIRVAAAKPLGAQIAACTIMYQAGSRYEVNDLGATHFIRAASSASGCGCSGFSKTRVLQQHGCSITCTTDRQSIAFTLRCPPTHYHDLKYYLLDAAARCCYNQWDIDDRKELVHGDLIRISPEQRVLDLVQKASWGGPLSNSMFCAEDRVNDMTKETLNCFVSNNFRSDQCTVASVGLSFEETMKLAESVEYRREQPKPRCEQVSFSRRGFEFHDLGQNSDTWIALCVPSCGTCDISCLMKHNIVAAAAGLGDMQLGQHAQDRTPMSPLGMMAGCDVNTQYRAFNISYFENGIFGILARTKAKTAWAVTVAAADFLNNIGDLNFKQIEVGQQRLKLALAVHDEDPVRVSEGLALQLANNVQLDSAKDSLIMVDMICADEISCTAKMLSSDCLAMAVVGDIGAVPHNRELACA